MACCSDALPPPDPTIPLKLQQADAAAECAPACTSTHSDCPPPARLPVAVRVPESFTLERAYILFSTMGLRHLVVVDEHNRVRVRCGLLLYAVNGLCGWAINLQLYR